MLDPNVEWLALAADELGPLCTDVVFVGSSVLGLLITDAGAPDVRPTEDIDCVVQVATKEEWLRTQLGLEAREFRADTSENAPMCRFLKGDLILDVIPSRSEILGFAGEWLSKALPHSQERRLPGGQKVSIISAPYFVASKLEAFADRGKGDFLVSEDLEDIVAVVSGRPSLVDEIVVASEEVRAYVAGQLCSLGDRFIEVLPGYLLPDPGSQTRIPIIARRLEKLMELF